MIITEEKRGELRKFGLSDKDIPQNVVESLTRLDKDLTLLWNIDDSQWEIYRIKHKGVLPELDVLHWQISAPEKGKFLTPGIAEWLRKFDTNPMGSLNKEEMSKNWAKQYKETRYKNNEAKRKELENQRDSWKGMIDDLGKEKTVVSVPITVGFNKKTGKKVFAVKK